MKKKIITADNIKEIAAKQSIVINFKIEYLKLHRLNIVFYTWEGVSLYNLSETRYFIYIIKNNKKYLYTLFNYEMDRDQVIFNLKN